MKVICNDKHWKIKDGHLILDTPEGQDAVKNMIKVLEKEIRMEIYSQICGFPFTDNRKEIMKHGLENSLLMVQDICAQIALGKSDAKTS